MIEELSLVRLLTLTNNLNNYSAINVSKTKSVLLDQVEKDLFANKPFWFGIVNNHSFIYMELQNIDTNVFLYNSNNIEKIPVKDFNQIFHSDTLKLSGITYSPRTLWELFTSEHIDMRELCDMTLVNAVNHTKQYLKNKIEQND